MILSTYPINLRRYMPQQNQFHHGLELKLQAVQLHENEGLTYTQIAQQLGMRTAAQVEVWVRRYRQEGYN